MSVGMDVCIITLYRSPDGDFNLFLDILHEVFELIRVLNKKLIITGDFNIHFNSDTLRNCKFSDFINSFGFICSVKEPTRNKNCLDNFLLNFDSFHNTSYTVDTNLSDHKAIVLELDIIKETPILNKIRYRPITQVGLNTLYNNLNIIDWDFVNDKKLNIDEKFHIFLNILVEQIDVAFPVKVKSEIPEKSNIQWYNDELREMRENLDFLHYLKKQYPNLVGIGDRVKEYRRIYRRKIEYYKKKCQ